MNRRILDIRFLGVVACCMISSMILLSSTASPPIVPISQLPQLEVGTVATVIGVLVDQWPRDDGSTSLVIADVSSDATVRIVYTDSNVEKSDFDIHVGDEVAATGEISSKRFPPTLFAENDGVVLLRKAEFVLTISTLASHWRLFLNDRFDIRGVIDLAGSSDSLRLVDESQNCGLSLKWSDDLSGFVGMKVVVSGCLVFDSCSMSLLLIVDGVSAVP